MRIFHKAALHCTSRRREKARPPSSSFQIKYLVVFEDGKRNLLALVVLLLGLGVVLLLALLAATVEAQHQVEGRLLLDVVVSQGTVVLELLARKDQTLLVRGDACWSADPRKPTDRR